MVKFARLVCFCMLYSSDCKGQTFFEIRLARCLSYVQYQKKTCTEHYKDCFHKAPQEMEFSKTCEKFSEAFYWSTCDVQWQMLLDWLECLWNSIRDKEEQKSMETLTTTFRQEIVEPLLQIADEVLRTSKAQTPNAVLNEIWEKWDLLNQQKCQFIFVITGLYKETSQIKILPLTTLYKTLFLQLAEGVNGFVKNPQKKSTLYKVMKLIINKTLPNKNDF